MGIAAVGPRPVQVQRPYRGGTARPGNVLPPSVQATRNRETIPDRRPQREGAFGGGQSGGELAGEVGGEG